MSRKLILTVKLVILSYLYICKLVGICVLTLEHTCIMTVLASEREGDKRGATVYIGLHMFMA